MYEDIFHDDPIELVIRVHPKSIEQFDKYNKISFNKLKSIIFPLTEIEICFIKTAKNIHKAIIPFKEENGQLELHLKWDNQTFSYRADIHEKKKTIFKVPISLPKQKNTFVAKVCQIKFLDWKESYRAKEELEGLFSRIEKLEVSSQVKIEEEQAIWDRYIEAQELIIKKLQEPFSITRYHQPKPIPNKEGDGIFKYTFQVDLKTEQKHHKYLEIEEQLKELDINERFNNKGEINLKLDDIFNGIDMIISRDFSNHIERSQRIGAIL